MLAPSSLSLFSSSCHHEVNRPPLHASALTHHLFAHTDEGPMPPFAISFYQEPPSNFNKSAAPDPLPQEKPSSKRPQAFIIACLVI
ncbi:hypothetical protein ACRRTK_018395 [Alexandromys fortis]